MAGPRRSGVLLLGALAVVVVAVAVFVGASFSSPSATVATLAPGSVAPRWSGTALDGTTLSSAATGGRWVVLNFFATWCTGCQAETPALRSFSDANRSRALVVSVLDDDSAAAARSYVRAHHVDWPIIVGGASAVIAAYRVDVGLPVTFVIRPDGRLATSFLGAATVTHLDAVLAGTS